MTEEYLKLRQKSYKAQSANSKQANLQTAMEYVPKKDIKVCDDETREMMRQLFNEIIKRNNFTPDEWKKVKIKVIHKKGDVENVSNYSLPAMYKLFSTILYGRLYTMLDQKQAEDQAGFRKIYQTTDHLATYRLIEQKCHEWGNQNVDSDGRLHEGFRLHHTQNQFGKHSILAMSNTNTSAS